ncbi:phosphate/phosphite/phosphonate ABC transporter substrate-binding protein [Magnetococcus sp. PR-3]|uniref:phosphate/phosphite/phosphonate ABC transporter substrate-binding protein n=1 Tax=Magnetococcus sp. PR-3 TaxID=3120355 RepID=UPI002FCE1879
MKPILYTSIITLATLSLSSAWADHKDSDVIHFGIVPQQSAIKLARKWTPVFQYLSQKTGYTIRFKTAPNIPVFEQRLADGRYDVAYMNPYHYTVFGQKPGYRAFAKQKDKQIKGLIVVHKDNAIQSLQDLSGQDLAFPAPAAFAASVLTRSKLVDQGIVFQPNYVSSHDSVYRTVAKGLFSAGGGIKRTLENVDPTIRAQLKILWTTHGYTPHAFAAHPALTTTKVAKLQQAMVNMHTDPLAQPLLKSLNFKGIETAQHQDWNDVRDLQVDKRLGRLIQ